jgi:hypothetical protein
MTTCFRVSAHFYISHRLRALRPEELEREVGEGGHVGPERC